MKNGQEQTILPLLLVVEDNANLRNYIQLLLQKNYRIVGLKNGQEAIDYLQIHQTDLEKQAHLIISDIMMPVMDGYQLLQKIKSTDDWRHLPLVMLTARADVQDKLKALRIGVDDYILKPFDEDELLVRIDNLLQNVQTRLVWTSQHQDTTAELPIPSTPAISQEDLIFLEKMEDLVSKNISNFNLTVGYIAAQLYIGQTQFYKKVKKLTGLTPNQYIQEVRYAKARQLLENQRYSTVKEVVYAIGVKDTRYFSKQFKKRFGKLPSDYLVKN